MFDATYLFVFLVVAILALLIRGVYVVHKYPPPRTPRRRATDSPASREAYKRKYLSGE